MKIGIMSMQRVVNYGSFLQAYGLKSILTGMGHSVEFVDYQSQGSLIQNNPLKPLDRYRSKATNAVKMLSPAYRGWRAAQIRSNQSCEKFHDVFENQFLPMLGVTTQRNERPKLDALVIGSDEVFNCTQTGDMVGYSRQLFGAENRADKLISYAASFGNTTLEKLQRYQITDEIARYLSTFDALSLRDHNSVQIVKTLCGIDGSYHIDPVLLYDFPEAQTISVDLKDYIVVYAYAGRINDQEAKAIRRFAEKKNKKLLSLGFWQTFCDDYVLASPLEVLAYIRHADYVITDTFHGSVFSIKYQKQFGAIVRDSNRQKLTDLLEQFGLEDRQLFSMDQIDHILEQPLDSIKVQQILQEKQKKAMTYLKEQLH